MAQDEVVKSRSEISGIEDVYLVAYLQMRGFVAIPYMKESKEGELSKRVVWDVQGKGIALARQDYFGNVSGIRDFVRSLKEVRQDMHSMRNTETTNDDILTDSQTTRRNKKV